MGQHERNTLTATTQIGPKHLNCWEIWEGERFICFASLDSRGNSRVWDTTRFITPYSRREIERIVKKANEDKKNRNNP